MNPFQTTGIHLFHPPKWSSKKKTQPFELSAVHMPFKRHLIPRIIIQQQTLYLKTIHTPNNALHRAEVVC